MRAVESGCNNPNRAPKGRSSGMVAFVIGTLATCTVGWCGADGSIAVIDAIAAEASVVDAKRGTASAHSKAELVVPRVESMGVLDPNAYANTPRPMGSTTPSGISASAVTSPGLGVGLSLDTSSDTLSDAASSGPGADPVSPEPVVPLEPDVPTASPEAEADTSSSPDELDPELAEPSAVTDPETSTIGRGRATPAPELLPLPRSRWIQHRRAPRESLTQIAYRYGVSEEKLREWNELGPDDPPPRPSKRLRVRARRLPPPRERIEHVVQAGDTWWSVALRHGVDGRDLRAYNYPYRHKMQPGATLQLWIDPVVHAWITSGPDPLPPDTDRQQRRGAVSIGSPADGVLLNGLRIPDDPGVWLRLPRSAYGTSHAVEQLMLAVAAFHERSDYPLRVAVGSMSRPRGGPIAGHVSHQSGRDVDLALLRRPEIPAWREIRGSRVQWDAMWQLVLAFAEVDAMVIFLDYHAQRRLYRAAVAAGASEAELDALIQYPRGSKASRGLVRHASGHELHMHVRFGCGSFETECVP
jgi:murein endopeptidase